MTNGACLESFDTTLPTWAGRIGSSVLTNVFPTMETSSLPVRSNEWFSTNVKVLQMDTEGGVLTNAVAYPDENAVTFASSPVYVDMRVRFDAMSDAPDTSLLSATKLAVFVSSECKLVAVHADGWTTNSTILDTNLWYQLTIKMLNGKYTVSLNDDPVFTDLNIQDAGTSNQLDATSFYGTGLIDELYVSHGDPAYSVAGPTTTIPDLPSDGDNPPTDEQQTRINAWLGNQTVSALTMTQDELSRSYLLNELTDNAGTGSAVNTTSFGISGIDVISPTELSVTVTLTTDNGAKEGSINGKLQLLGKTTINGSWVTLEGAITPSYADFTNGQATYTYIIPSGGYRFFRPQIVP